MRKFSQMILTLLFAIPMLFGGLSTLGVFSNASKTASNGLNTLLATSNGGGGADSLKGDDNGDLPHPDTQETITYTFKTYEDYFIDYFNLPAETYTRDETTGVVTIDYTKITRKTANGETQLSYNGNVFYTITSDDLTGTGSESDPYVVHSTKGFLYLTNYSFSKLILGSRYIELENDIILNDETFDENGNPSSGDGVVYCWASLTQNSILGFDGQNNIIKGMYLITEKQHQGLFGAVTITTCENLIFDNVYISSTEYAVYTIAQKCLNVTHCIIRSGTIRGKKQVAALCMTTTCISNSSNYANIYAGSTASGMVYSVGISMTNCDNFGDVFCEGSPTGGLISSEGSDKVVVSSCNNYGNLSGKAYVGGIVSGHYYYTKSIQIKNCANFGKISGTKLVGGILGYSCAQSMIDGCSNYGAIFATEGSAGCITGYVYDNSKTGKVNVNIINCNNFVDGNISDIIFFVQNMTSNTNLKILNSYNHVKNYKGQALILEYIAQTQTAEIRNMHIQVENNTAGKTILVKTNNNTVGKVLIRDVLVQDYSICNSFTIFQYCRAKELLKIDACLYLSNNYHSYYGSNFSGFYVSWRTGKIGLVALDGRGSFQGKIDEEWLRAKGFEKKEI